MHRRTPVLVTLATAAIAVGLAIPALDRGRHARDHARGRTGIGPVGHRLESAS